MADFPMTAPETTFPIPSPQREVKMWTSVISLSDGWRCKLQAHERGGVEEGPHAPVQDSHGITHAGQEAGGQSARAPYRGEPQISEPRLSSLLCIHLGFIWGALTEFTPACGIVSYS